MHNLLLAGLGGFIGSVFRFLLTALTYRWLNYPIFPYGTLLVNVTGCFIIGLLNGIAENQNVFSPELRVFMFVGVLGGFTTYSSFGYETFALFRDDQLGVAGLNILLQLSLGFLAVWLGFQLSRVF
ncbi:MAG: fluoride efflux transporter CrcB [Gammaproteobacteria bacterium]|nr:fluoride efflux transporter CrcB [Gammaproteobacteria bacterium]